MYKLSSVVSKQVVALTGAQALGIVVDVLFNDSLKRADSLLLMDCEENDEAYLRLPMRLISSLGGDAVVVKALGAPLAAYLGQKNSPINRRCYDQDGKDLGVVTDVELNDNFSVNAFITGGRSFPVQTLLSFSQSLIIFNDSGAPIKLPRPKARPPRPDDKLTQVFTAAQSDKAALAAAKSYAPEREISAGITLPVKASSPPPWPAGAPDFSFLLGRRVARALYSSSGRLIAPQDAVITENVIVEAGRENKLVQLTLRAY